MVDDDDRGHLSISPYTVQDHLRSIFDKTGVHSRRELISQIFFEEHWPQR
jgi:DNA-binding NarL/FixJ family response regulator